MTTHKVCSTCQTSVRVAESCCWKCKGTAFDPQVESSPRPRRFDPATLSIVFVLAFVAAILGGVRYVWPLSEPAARPTMHSDPVSFGDTSSPLSSYTGSSSYSGGSGSYGSVASGSAERILREQRDRALETALGSAGALAGSNSYGAMQRFEDRQLELRRLQDELLSNPDLSPLDWKRVTDALEAERQSNEESLEALRSLRAR